MLGYLGMRPSLTRGHLCYFDAKIPAECVSSALSRWSKQIFFFFFFNLFTRQLPQFCFGRLCQQISRRARADFLVLFAMMS